MTSQPDTRVVALSIPARPEYIALCRLALAGLTQVRPFEPEALADLKLALTEACTNSVRHAYGSSEGMVEITYELYPDRLVVEVADEGAGFDAEPQVGMGARLRAEELAEGGLGIAIIEALADEFEITERARGGSSLRFVKLLA